MPFDSHFINVSVVPHVFSRLDSKTKERYKEKYVTIKKTVLATSVATIGAIDGYSLVKDVVSSKLKAHAYKSIFAIALGPIVQVVSLPFYIYSNGSKLRNVSISLCSVGAKIIKGEMQIVNWAWLGADLLLFGEPIEILNNETFMILGNETESTIANVVDVLGSKDD